MRAPSKSKVIRALEARGFTQSVRQRKADGRIVWSEGFVVSPHPTQAFIRVGLHLTQAPTGALAREQRARIVEMFADALMDAGMSVVNESQFLEVRVDATAPAQLG